MTAHHFFVEPEAIAAGVVTLTGDDARHAARVLRIRECEEITVADDTGRIVHAVVAGVGDVVVADVLKERSVEPSRPAITLVQALTKGVKFDEIVQKATEVGVARITPFVAERSVVRWDAAKRAKARSRWAEVARAAAKQCKAARLTVISDVADDVTAAIPDATVWVLHEADGATLLRDSLEGPAPDEVAIVVGPEGGLRADEVSRLVAAGADVVGLGPRILRTETAGPIAAAIVAFAYGTLG